MYPLQISFGKNSIDPKKFNPILNNEVKPIGGLWASTYTPQVKYLSDWQEFALSISRKEGLTQAVLFDIKPQTRIFTIDSKRDLNQLVQAFGEVKPPLPFPLPWTYLNFKKISKHYDILHLTKDGQADTRFGFQDRLSLYGWDVESSLIFRTSIIDKWYPIKITY